MTIRGLVPRIDEVERETEDQPVPGVDVVMITVPMPTYRALSDIAAKKNLTVTQFIAKVLSKAVREIQEA